MNRSETAVLLPRHEVVQLFIQHSTVVQHTRVAADVLASAPGDPHFLCNAHISKRRGVFTRHWRPVCS